MPKPQDPAWWRKVKTPSEFCEKGGLSECGKAKFLDRAKSSDKDEIVSFAWLILAENLGHTLPRIIPLVKNEDVLVKAFLLLDKHYGSDGLSNKQRDEAVERVEALLRVSHSKTPAVPNFKAAAKAFSCNEKPTPQGYFSSEGVFSTLMQQHAQYTDHHISPYTTIVGPSGIGKSFAVQQLAVRYGVYVVYNNLAPATSRGFPRPVAMGAIPISEERDAMIEQWIAYLETQLLIADCCKKTGITAPGLFYFLTSNSTQILAARATFLTLITDLLETENKEVQMCQGLAVVKEVLQKLELNSIPTTPPHDSKLPVIVCFDEARALLDRADNWAFRSLRQAAKKLADNLKDRDSDREGGYDDRKEMWEVPFFMVLLDTTSKISNFTPPLRHDPSAKVANQRIFHPIYEIDSLGTFAPKDITDPSGHAAAVSRMFSYGRPLWGALLQTGYSWTSLLGLAVDKMSGYEDRAVSDIAVLSYRMSFYISSATMAKDLVASMMRCLVSISTDRNELITAQPSEPVLAFAAAKLLQDPPTRLSCIRSWIGGLHSGALNPGDIGEQVACLVLLFTFDSVAFGTPAGQDTPPQAVPLGDFIAALLGEQVRSDLLRIHAGTATGLLLQEGAVFFNHFVRTTAAPTIEVLENAYRRGAALFLPAFFPGMDVALPIRAAPGGPLALLLLQVKNRKGDANTPGLRLSMVEDLHKAVKHLGLSTELHAVAGLVMCLRTQGEPQFIATAADSTVEAAASRISARPSVKGKELSIASSGISTGLLGIAFGLGPTVYPSLQAPSRRRKRTRLQSTSSQSQGLKAGQGEMEEICRLLGRLVNSWPHAYAEADTDSTYAQRLVDPFFDLAEAARDHV